MEPGRQARQGSEGGEAEGGRAGRGGLRLPRVTGYGSASSDRVGCHHAPHPGQRSKRRDGESRREALTERGGESGGRHTANQPICIASYLYCTHTLTHTVRYSTEHSLRHMPCAHTIQLRGYLLYTHTVGYSTSSSQLGRVCASARLICSPEPLGRSFEDSSGRAAILACGLSWCCS